jgi:O-antigen ligase
MTLGATAVVGVLLHVALQLPFSSGGLTASNSPRDLTSLSSRDILWRLAFEATMGSPFFGIGPGQFTRFETYAGAHPHNWALQLASEWGLPALLAVLIGLVGLGRRVVMALRNSQHVDPLLTAASLSVLVALVSAMVDGTLVMPATQVQFAAVFGLMVGSVRRVDPPGRLDSSMLTLDRRAVAGAMVASMLVLCIHAHSTYALQAAEKAAFQERFPGKWLTPRFWENGLSLAQ